MGLKGFITDKRKFFFIIPLIIAISFVIPQHGYGKKHILKFLVNYSPRDYRMQPQNWFITQDKRGIIYAANQAGVMEFDGVCWKEIMIPNLTARSIALADNQTIYVGGKNEIGFLTPNAKGSLTYKSLLPHLNENLRNFGPVWKTHALKKKIYFHTSKYLFCWNLHTRQMKVWEAKSIFTASFTCNGEFYIRQRNIGLMQMINDSPVLLPGGEIFREENIYMMVPYEGQKLLLGIRSDQFYLYDGKKTTPFPISTGDYLEEKKLIHGIRLSCGDFALATRFGGLVILDSKGKLKNIFNRKTGLPDDNVWYTFEDFQGNLWLALNKGLAKVEYASSYSIYDDTYWNLPGIVLCAARYGPNEDLYAGTTSGLFLLTPASKFNPVAGISGMCWSLLSTVDSLLAATDQGVFPVEKNGPVRIIETPSYTLLKSRKNTNRIWVGTRDGLTSLYPDKKSRRWLEEHNFKNINHPVRTIEEDERGDLWLGTLTKGVIYVRFPAPAIITAAEITVFGSGQGLPSGEVYVFQARGKIRFATPDGVFRFDEKSNTFIPDFLLGEKFAGGPGGRSIFRIVEDKKRNIWFHSGKRNFQAVPQKDGAYEIIEKPFLRIPFNQVNAIYPDPGENITWLASNIGLICWDTSIIKNFDCDFQAIIRKVWINGKLFFDGCEKSLDSAGSDFRSGCPVIEYKDRNLRFEFAAPFFEAESETIYQYQLAGYNDHWSGWSRETIKDFTNLDSGLHTFRVRAKNIYGDLSREAAFQFKVLPPWHQTWWAFLIYIMSGIFIMYLVVKWRLWKLEREKQNLAHIIKERTGEINQQKQQLLEQAEKLKELDEAKSRFYANISHEFRTPLTLIMGPLEQILSANPDREMESKANLMLRNSRRLLNLINQLLELAKFESGKMQLEVMQQDIVSFLRSIVLCFESLAMQKKIDLNFFGKENDILVYFDPDKLEKIITNLLSNAFNYTPESGKISVTVCKTGENKSFSAGNVEISVHDTGSGIPEDQLPYIFDRFYRGEGSRGYEWKGTGIGLALCKDLVELHHGDIRVFSNCSDIHKRGTEFILRLPMGKEHLQPEEIVEPAIPSQSSQSLITNRNILNRDKSNHQEVSENNQNFLPGGPGGGYHSVFSKRVSPGRRRQENILIVEDNPIERLFLKVTLEEQFTVVEAADGREGILRARELIPDLIVSDIIMPGINGYELCRKLKKDILTSHIPIMLLTAKGSEESELQGLVTGADDYITKPFSKSLLVARARNLLELRRQLHLERKNRMRLQPDEIPVSPIDKEFYKKLQEVVEVQLSDPDFNVEALSRELRMSQATLYRKIQALTGKTPTLFLRTYRIKRAAQLLEAHAGNVSEVANMVGIQDKSYFARCFKEQFHCLPSELQLPGESGEDEHVNSNPESQPDTKENNQKLLRKITGSGGGTTRFHEKSPPGRRRQEIILVVEDSEDARNYIQESLQPDYRVIEAGDGSEGIARAMEIIPDLVISDIMMPGTDGYELCRVLKKDIRTSHIPIIFLTAKVSEESVIRGLETGADDYITKPFNAKMLLARIKNLIRLRSHLHKNRDREMTLLPARISESDIDREFMKELNSVIEKNLSDAEFNVDRLAKKLYMSRITLYRKIFAIYGETPTEFIRSHRLRRGAQLLEKNIGSVIEVAFEVGFSNSSYFAKCFKEVFHQSPSDYQVSRAK